ncbi:MAG: MBOAT family protein [Oscillospiraceae bacterium]|nr:MBOAT family protein [Oscillospiraceae bacterium]MBQ8835759.1 MBOAT family protein [Oscillospiraceae bacterium]
MRFTSLTFGLFAGALLFLYYRVPGRAQWAVLLLGSLVFYLSAGAEYLPFLLLAAATTFFAARFMAKRTEKAAKRRALLLCLLADFGLLAVCKCAGYLPMGISFYLFQSAGYVIDVYRGTAKAEGNFLRHALFVSYFPQLVQGPISRHGQLEPQLFHSHEYDPKEVSFGIQRMLWGAFKKLVIADRVAPAVVALKECRGLGFLLLTVLYAVQIYADFTGGIDIALGLSRCFGITLPENFRSPFRAKNTAEYWRRWHITLGEWMKDYIFYPVSVSAPMRRLSKAARKRWPKFGKRLPVYAASFATWFVTGIWHGVTPNFLVWGLLNCAVIVISEELTPLYKKFHSRFRLKEKKWYGGFEITRMFLLMNLIRACDLFPNVGDYFRRLGSLFTPWTWECALPDLGLTGLDWAILALGVALMLGLGQLRDIQETLWQRPALRYCLLFLLFLAVLLLGKYGVGYDAAAFIYNQF